MSGSPSSASPWAPKTLRRPRKGVRRSLRQSRWAKSRSAEIRPAESCVQRPPREAKRVRRRERHGPGKGRANGGAAVVSRGPVARMQAAIAEAMSDPEWKEF